MAPPDESWNANRPVGKATAADGAGPSIRVGTVVGVGEAVSQGVAVARGVREGAGGEVGDDVGDGMAVRVGSGVDEGIGVSVGSAGRTGGVDDVRPPVVAVGAVPKGAAQPARVTRMRDSVSPTPIFHTLFFMV
jgi:hypothetical protein